LGNINFYSLCIFDFNKCSTSTSYCRTFTSTMVGGSKFFFDCSKNCIPNEWC